MELPILILSGFSLLIVTVILLVLLIQNKRDGQSELRMEINSSIRSFGQTISDNQKNAAQLQEQRLQSMEESNSRGIRDLRESQEDRIESLEKSNEQKLEAIRQTMERRLSAMQEENAEKLSAMQKVVDEKLEKSLETRITESFKLVSGQLEQVYKGLGEMQNVASGVSDLKKVLSNVKTRGILGEAQLGAILSEILAPEQYERDVATKPDSRDRVEFAIRLPGDGEHTVYLPIDAKFPAETYALLQDAYEQGDAERIALAAKQLEIRLKSEAKDIRDKYIEPPHTTDFGILFLPFEGLYAEAVNRGLIEELQRAYRVNVTGPSTMAAFLNSLQMGFRTLAIQQRSGEVWQVLGAVKTEFEKFGEVLERSQTRLQQVNNELDTLIGTRTRAINRKLKEVERLDSPDAGKFLDA